MDSIWSCSSLADSKITSQYGHTSPTGVFGMEAAGARVTVAGGMAKDVAVEAAAGGEGIL